MDRSYLFVFSVNFQQATKADQRHGALSLVESLVGWAGWFFMGKSDLPLAAYLIVGQKKSPEVAGDQVKAKLE